MSRSAYGLEAGAGHAAAVAGVVHRLAGTPAAVVESGPRWAASLGRGGAGRARSGRCRPPRRASLLDAELRGEPAKAWPSQPQKAAPRNAGSSCSTPEVLSRDEAPPGVFRKCPTGA